MTSATRYSLANSAPTRDDQGDVSYENDAKRVTIGGEDSSNRDLILEIRGAPEYAARARRPGESWPHLLVEQDASKLCRLDDLHNVLFTISLRLLYCVNHMAKGDYNPSLHAAQFQMFFIVKNVNGNSDGYGDYYWFGVPFFDNRHDIPPQYMARDAGKSDATGKFIYTVAGRTVGMTSLTNGRWVTIHKDVLPYIKAGLKEATKKGYLRSDNCHDYAVANMNLGWEIPGTFNASVQLRDLDISAVIKNANDGSAAQ